MDILTEVKELKEANAQLDTNHKAATESLSAALGELNNFKAEVDTHKATIASQLEQINDLVSKLEANGNELTAIKAEVESLKANQLSADKKAVKILASQGVAPMPVKAGASEAVSKEDILTHYNALVGTNPKAAAEYYAAHRKQLFGK